MAYKGLDSVIETLKGKLSFSWLDRSYGLADRITELRGDKPFIFPACYSTTDGDPVSMLPRDDYSYAFWVRNGEAKFINPEIGQLPVITYPVSLIFYMELNYTGKKEARSKVTEDIFNWIYTVRGGCILSPVKFIEDDITKVFDGFSFEELDNKWKIFPKWCCRVDFDLTFRFSCYSTNLYA